MNDNRAGTKNDENISLISAWLASTKWLRLPAAKADWIRGYSVVLAVDDSTATESTLYALAVVRASAPTHYQNSHHTSKRYYLELNHRPEMCPT